MGHRHHPLQVNEVLSGRKCLGQSLSPSAPMDPVSQSTTNNWEQNHTCDKNIAQQTYVSLFLDKVVHLCNLVGILDVVNQEDVSENL